MKWWRLIVSNEGMALSDLASCQNCEKVCDALIQICACADEACEGIGLTVSAADPFDLEVEAVLRNQLLTYKSVRTLCKEIDTSNISVLPKLHTPQSGMTIRSMSHHLALCSSGEVEPQFVTAAHKSIDQHLNLLLVPWPEKIQPSHFSEVSGSKPLENLPSNYGFFEYSIRGGRHWPTESFHAILEEAKTNEPNIHGVILPELSMTETDVDHAWAQIQTTFPSALLIGGLGQSRGDDKFGFNKAVCLLPQLGRHSKFYQCKHHRWMLNRAQIEQYGLFNRLGADKLWWESTALPSRVLKFVQLTPWLTFCFLICEDLARQDPISEMIRSVGPNLVIALLMDGPQFAHRWSARYAMVLADDPGSSVLTLTSLGMARLSTCLGKPEARVIALWKDSTAGPFEITLPHDSAAVILHIVQRRIREFSADGRSDDEAAATWILKGTTPVRERAR